MTKPEWSEVGYDHNLTKMMQSLIDGHRQLCAEARVSPWDFCVMLANVQGIILGRSKNMPTDKALERVGQLGKVAVLRIHEERAPDTGSSKVN